MPEPNADQEPEPDMDALGDPGRWGEGDEELLEDVPGVAALAGLIESSDRVADLPGGPTGQAIHLARAAAELLQGADRTAPHYDRVLDLGRRLVELAYEKMELARHSNGWPPSRRRTDDTVVGDVLRRLREEAGSIPEAVVTPWLLPSGVATLLELVDSDSGHHLVEKPELMKKALRGLGRRAVEELVCRRELRAEDAGAAVAFEEPE